MDQPKFKTDDGKIFNVFDITWSEDGYLRAISVHQGKGATVFFGDSEGVFENIKGVKGELITERSLQHA